MFLGRENSTQYLFPAESNGNHFATGGYHISKEVLLIDVYFVWKVEMLKALMNKSQVFLSCSYDFVNHYCHWGSNTFNFYFFGGTMLYIT